MLKVFKIFQLSNQIALPVPMLKKFNQANFWLIKASLAAANPGKQGLYTSTSHLDQPLTKLNGECIIQQQ